MTGSAVGLRPDTLPRDVALDTAGGLASRLVREAVWSGGRCSWVGAEPMERIDGGGSAPSHVARLTFRALGPDLYGGTSGVGLFLAEVAAVTGHHGALRTALGALRHALSRADDVAPRLRPGLHVGWCGIAHAALRAGTVLDVPELVERGHWLLLEAAGRGPGADRAAVTGGTADADSAEFDIVAGGAGTVLALLGGHRRTGDGRLLDAAVAVADRLLGSARRRDVGWSWWCPAQGDGEDLTGMSHGAAGVALALIEAYRATGEASFAVGARQAMRYEDHWLDAGRGNWPDFRPDVDGRRSRHRPTAFATLWCHGAPGIALVRLHAHRHLGDPAWHDDATVAVRTTARATEAMLDSSGSNFSLCHGLAGNAECLRAAPQGLLESVAGADLVDRVARNGVERHARTGGPWPCGTHTDETPNLMLGLAGVGLFYLRLADPAVPSVLLPVAP